jgi:hypothetical protein
MKTLITLPDSARTRLASLVAAFALVPGMLSAGLTDPGQVTGQYLEVRSCDVYTGSCFANAEMGLAGREGILVWKIDQGAWNGVDLAGLNVIAVLRTDQTLGDVRYQPRRGRAVLITDERATVSQREALVEFARSAAGSLVADVQDVKVAPITASIGACGKMGCATVSAPGLVEISSRCLADQDHVCGHEATFYPPLTRIEHAVPAFSEIAAYRGDSLNLKWEGHGKRNVFLGRFAY